MDPSRQSAEVFHKHAQAYLEKFRDVGRYQLALDRFLASLPAGPPRVLELGCGPGNLTRYLLDQRPDLEIHGLDLAPAMIDLARDLNPEASFLVSDIRNLDLNPDTWDAVLAGFVFPYLTHNEMVAVLAQLAQGLKPGGSCCIGTLTGNPALTGWYGPSDGGPDRTHIRVQTIQDVTRSLESAGFTPPEILEVPPLAGPTPGVETFFFSQIV